MWGGVSDYKRFLKVVQELKQGELFGTECTEQKRGMVISYMRWFEDYFHYIRKEVLNPPELNKSETFDKLISDFLRDWEADKETRKMKRMEIISWIKKLEEPINDAREAIEYSRLDESDESDETEKRMQTLKELFMNDFNNLRVEYDFSGIPLKDFNRLNWEKDYIREYYEWYYDREIFIKWGVVTDNWEVKENIKNATNLQKDHNFLRSGEEIIDYIREIIIGYYAYDEDDEEEELHESESLSDREVVVKYKDDAKQLLEDNDIILREICKGFENIYSQENYSLTVSMFYYVAPDKFDFAGWNKIKKWLDQVKD